MRLLKIITILAFFTASILLGKDQNTIPKEFAIFNPANSEIKGFYHFTGPTRWGKLLGVENANGWICSQIDPTRKEIKVKFLKEDKIYDLKLLPDDGDYFTVEYKNNKLLKGVFVKEKGEDWISVKFFDLNEEINPKARYTKRLTGTKYITSYFVRNIKSFEDCEMEYRIGGCTQDPIENREWPNCKPPGYNNIK